MSNITLTITLDEDQARQYVKTYGDSVDAWAETHVAKAIAAALPPRSPKEGEVWRSAYGTEYEIGPSKWGTVLVNRHDYSGAASTGFMVIDTIIGRWTKVR